METLHGAPRKIQAATPPFRLFLASLCFWVGGILTLLTLGAATAIGNTIPVGRPRLSVATISREVAKVGLETIASGLNSPVDLVVAPGSDNRLFIVDQAGQIRLIKDGQLLNAAFLDLSARLIPLELGYDERGFLGLAFHPGFNDPASSGFGKLYTLTSEPVARMADFSVTMVAGPDHQAVLAEWQVSSKNPDLVDRSTRREVLRIDEPQPNHNGGKLAFRPSDGYLYVGLGDGGASNDVGDGHSAGGNGQDLLNVLGKILRIDPLAPALTSTSADPTSANGRYRIPQSNPFVGKSKVDEIYAYGLRNPYRFSFDIDEAGVDRLIVGDVGQNQIEEVDLVEAGRNYGWGKKEGTFLFDSRNGSIAVDPFPNPALSDPILQYDHHQGSSIIGGLVYRGSAIPELRGKYFFGDFTLGIASPGGRLFTADLGSTVIRELKIGPSHLPLGLYLKGIGSDRAGEIYVLGALHPGPSGETGTVFKIVPSPDSVIGADISARKPKNDRAASHRPG